MPENEFNDSPMPDLPEGYTWSVSAGEFFTERCPNGRRERIFRIGLYSTDKVLERCYKYFYPPCSDELEWNKAVKDICRIAKSMKNEHFFTRTESEKVEELLYFLNGGAERAGSPWV